MRKLLAVVMITLLVSISAHAVPPKKQKFRQEVTMVANTPTSQFQFNWPRGWGGASYLILCSVQDSANNNSGVTLARIGHTDNLGFTLWLTNGASEARTATVHCMGFRF